jgi:Rv0078B-related antitoxin
MMNPPRLPEIEMVDPEMAKILRDKTAAERLAISHGMWRFARNTIRNLLHAEHPQWADDRLDQEVAKRMSHGTV